MQHCHLTDTDTSILTGIATSVSIV